MDFSVLLRPEVFILTILLTLIGILFGFALGKMLQARHAEDMLAAVNRTHARSIADLEADNTETLHRLRDGHVQEMERIKAQMTQELEAAEQIHQTEIKRRIAEHTYLVNRLSTTNNTNLRELRKEHEAALLEAQQQHEQALAAQSEQHKEEIRNLKGEMEKTLRMFREAHARATENLRNENLRNIESLKVQHNEATETLKQAHGALQEQTSRDYKRQIDELRAAWQVEVQELKARIQAHEAGNERLRHENHTLQDTIRELNDSIKEAKRNNTFSLSKSGERLIRVIRSVQDLAQELDETSRAVSDGEYSLFDAIKDQRDRETIFQLTGGQQPRSTMVADADAEQQGATASMRRPIDADVDDEPAYRVPPDSDADMASTDAVVLDEFMDGAKADGGKAAVDQATVDQDWVAYADPQSAASEKTGSDTRTG